MFIDSDRESLKAFAHEAIQHMLSYNVSKIEAYNYLTNKIELPRCSYELQCCIYDNDPIEYCRKCPFYNPEKFKNE
jgi:hypothetical protein